MTAPNQRERILPRLIEDEMKESFIDYSMSVIVSRALARCTRWIEAGPPPDPLRDETSWG